MQYRPGDYVCVNITTGRNIFSKIMDGMIRAFTNSHYNHAFVIVNEHGDIIEATPRGAKLSYIGEYDGEDKLFSTTDLTDEQRIKIVANAHACIGKPYGFLDIIYLALALKGIRPRWLLNQVLREDRMICSQLVAYTGTNANTVDSWLCGQEYAQLVTPGLLGTLAEAGGDAVS